MAGENITTYEPNLTTTSAALAVKLGWIRATCITKAENSNNKFSQTLNQSILAVLCDESHQHYLTYQSEKKNNRAPSSNPTTTKLDHLSPGGIILSKDGLVELDAYLDWLGKLNETEDESLKQGLLPHPKTGHVSPFGSAAIAGVGDIAWKTSNPMVDGIIMESHFAASKAHQSAEVAFLAGEAVATICVLTAANYIIGEATRSSQFNLAKKTLEAERHIIINASNKLTPLDTSTPEGSFTRDSDSGSPDRVTAIDNHPAFQHNPSFCSQNTSDSLKTIDAGDNTSLFEKEVNKHYQQELLKEQFSADDSGRAIKDIWTWWMLGFELAKLTFNVLSFIVTNSVKAAVFCATGPGYFAIAAGVMTATALSYGNNKEIDFWRDVYYDEHQDIIKKKLEAKNKAIMHKYGLIRETNEDKTPLEKNVASYLESVRTQGSHVKGLESWFKQAGGATFETWLSCAMTSPYYCLRNGWQKMNGTANSTQNRAENLISGLWHAGNLPQGCNAENRHLFSAELSRQLRRKYAPASPENSQAAIDTERYTDFTIAENKLTAETRQKGLVHMQSIVEGKEPEQAKVGKWYRWEETRATKALQNEKKQAVMADGANEADNQVYDKYLNEFLPDKHDSMTRVCVTIGFLLIPFADIIGTVGLILKTAVTAAFAFTTTAACSYFGNQAKNRGISLFSRNNPLPQQGQKQLSNGSFG